MLQILIEYAQQVCIT